MVEYIAVSRGPRVGRASAEIVANVIWAQALALRAASRVNRSPRAARKSIELGETRGALRRAVASEDGTPARAWPGPLHAAHSLRASICDRPLRPLRGYLRDARWHQAGTPVCARVGLADGDRVAV